MRSRIGRREETEVVLVEKTHNHSLLALLSISACKATLALFLRLRMQNVLSTQLVYIYIALFDQSWLDEFADVKFVFHTQRRIAPNDCFGDTSHGFKSADIAQRDTVPFDA